MVPVGYIICVCGQVVSVSYTYEGQASVVTERHLSFNNKYGHRQTLWGTWSNHPILRMLVLGQSEALSPSSSHYLLLTCTNHSIIRVKAVTMVWLGYISLPRTGSAKLVYPGHD